MRQRPSVVYGIGIGKNNAPITLDVEPDDTENHNPIGGHEKGELIATTPPQINGSRSAGQLCYEARVVARLCLCRPRYGDQHGHSRETNHH
jgi:hypothetical protein